MHVKTYVYRKIRTKIYTYRRKNSKIHVNCIRNLIE
jgi:hypothetical protein